MPTLDDHLQPTPGADSDTPGIIFKPSLEERRLEHIPKAAVRLAGLARHGPAWRWKLAEIMNGRRRARRTTDYGTEVWHAVRFQAQSADVVPSRYLEGYDVAVAEAYAIYCDPAQRLQTEARILTGVGIEQVAHESGNEPRVIRDYCSLFFDVLDKLPARSWIAANVIESPHEMDCHVRRLLYRSAYFGGWHACEYCLARYKSLGQPHDLSTADGRELEQLELLLQAEHVAVNDPERVSEITIKLGDLTAPKAHAEKSVAELLAAQVNRCLQAVLPPAEHETEVAAPSIPRSAVLISA